MCLGDDVLKVTTLELGGQWQGQTLTLEVVDEQHYRLLDAEGNLLMHGTVGENALSGDIKVFVQRMEASPGARFALTSISDLSAINSIKSRFTAERNGSDTGVVTLSLSGSDQQAIVSTLDTITDVFLQQNIERESAEADNQLGFLGDQIPTLRGQLDEAESALNDYRRRRDSVDLTAESQQVMENLVGLDNQLTEIKLRLAELSRAYTHEHPAYRALVARRDSLNQEKARVQKQAEQLPAAQREALNLNRNVNVSQEIYVALLNKREEVRLKKAGTVGNVRILDPAVLQPGPISPRTSLMMVVFAMAGFLLGVLGILLRHSMRKGIDSAEQIESLDLPVYATIPLSPLQQGMMRRVRLKGEKSGREIYHGVLATSQPSDISIEALRSLRTSLHFALLDNQRKSVMFTGPSPGIGKSFVSLNLAAVSAEAGQRVLLIDADMRRGHFTTPSSAPPSRAASRMSSAAQVLWKRSSITRASTTWTSWAVGWRHRIRPSS
ncbi:GNVR domain-containing protein [Cobetia marina]